MGEQSSLRRLGRLAVTVLLNLSLLLAVAGRADTTDFWSCAWSSRILCRHREQLGLGFRCQSNTNALGHFFCTVA